MHKIGFMQGRLSPKPSDRIQAFPKDSWKEEFGHASELGFDCIEVIYDDLYLENNPLASPSGREELKQLSVSSGIQITSICADYFMIHRLADQSNQKEHLNKAEELIDFAKQIDCKLVEFPFVDSSSVLDPAVHDLVLSVMQKLAEKAKTTGVRIAVETDLPPQEFKGFLEKLPDHVGANLDLGNSASLGYDVQQECRAFGHRIFNVHIKDRVFGGTTVPLTEGDVDFELAFRSLSAARYRGNFILQTAPSPNYLDAADRYRKMVQDWMKLL